MRRARGSKPPRTNAGTRLVPACRADVAHEGEGVFISTKDIALLEEYQGNDSAALAELLSSDEVGAFQLPNSASVCSPALCPPSTGCSAVCVGAHESSREHFISCSGGLLFRLDAELDLDRYAAPPHAVLACHANWLPPPAHLAAIMTAHSVEVDTDTAIDKFREDPNDHSSRMRVGPLLRTVKRADDSGDMYILEQAATAAARLVAADSTGSPSGSELLRWAMASISRAGSVLPGTPEGRRAEAAVSALMLLLRHRTVREQFLLDSSSVQALLPLLASRDLQLAYEAANCLWVLTFCTNGRVSLLTTGAVQGLAQVVRLDLPVKLLRMGVMALANVVEKFDEDAQGHTDLPEPLPLLGEAAVLKPLTELPKVAAKAKKYQDPELLEAADYLVLALNRSRRSLTSLKRYKAQLASGTFKPGPLHAADFWQENVFAFEASDWALVRSLKQLLESPDSSAETLAVAVQDVGQFTVYHPHGRSVLVSLGLKDSIMALMQHESQDVRHAALLSLSKLMLTKWEFAEQSAAHSRTAGGRAAS